MQDKEIRYSKNNRTEISVVDVGMRSHTYNIASVPVIDEFELKESSFVKFTNGSDVSCDDNAGLINSDSEIAKTNNIEPTTSDESTSCGNAGVSNVAGVDINSVNESNDVGTNEHNAPNDSTNQNTITEQYWQSDSPDYAQNNDESSAQVTHNENVFEGSDYSSTNDATNVQNVIINQVQHCVEHEMQLVETRIDAEYELYDYVTDIYKCINCEHTTNSVHIAASDVSATEISCAENTIIACVNNLRASNGLNPLWVDGVWSAWAKTRAVEQSYCYGHIRPNGESWLYAIGNHYTVGENVASGQSSGYGFYNAFLNSPQHKDAMLAQEAVGIAVSIYIDEFGNTYCAMIIIG